MATKPLTMEELMAAQQRILDTDPDPEMQKKAMATMAKLTKLRGDSQNVSLGDVKTEIKGLRQDLKATSKNNEAVTPLPKNLPTSLPVPADDGRESDVDRTTRLKKLGAVIESKTSIERGGARNESVMDRNRSTFDKFVTESSKREELLKDASDKQVEIFEKLEDTITKLREAGSDDSKELQDQIAKLSGELSQTEDTKARGKIGGLTENALTRATVGARGNQGNLGDAFAALTGKKNVLKEGFSSDARGGGIRNDATGKYASKGAATMGRVAGAASIFGSFIGDKANKFIESKRSPAIQDFMNTNIRATDTSAARLAGEQQALSKAPTPTAAPTPITVPTSTAAPTPIMAPSAKAVTPAALYEDSGSVEKASGDALTVPAMSKLLDDLAKKLIEGGVGGGGGGGGSMLDSAMDMIPDGKGKASAKILSKGGGMLSRAGGMLKGAGGMLKGAAPGLLKGGIGALGGAALGYGADKLKESGHEKLGGAADVASSALSWGGTGAMIGSVIPGVGTAIGAGVGAAAGGAYGLYKNWGNLFGGDKKAGAAAGASPAGKPAEAKAETKQITSTSFPIIAAYKESVVKGEMTPDEALAGIKSIAGDNPELMKAAQEEIGSLKSKATKASKVEPAAKSVDTGSVVASKSAANESYKTSQGNKPIIIQGGGQSAPPAPPPVIQAPRGAVRPNESAMERYSMASAHYF